MQVKFQQTKKREILQLKTTAAVAVKKRKKETKISVRTIYTCVSETNSELERHRLRIKLSVWKKSAEIE